MALQINFILIISLAIISFSLAQEQKGKKKSSHVHLMTPNEFSTLCPHSLDTSTCFGKYTMKLLEKARTRRSTTEMNTLWDFCLPGDDRVSCFDQYIDNIKLLKRNNKPMAIECTNEGSLIDCFDNYIMRSQKRSRIGRSGNGICPPGEDLISCFDKYINSMKLMSYAPNKRSSNCIAGETSLKCLERYIKAIKTRDIGYIFRNGVRCQPDADEKECLDKYVHKVKLNKKRIGKRMAISCQPGDSDIKCFDKYVQSMKLIKREERKRSQRFRCFNIEDDLSCFDRYISDVKLRTNNLGVGKRASFDFHCGPGEDSLACLDKYVDDIKLGGSSKRSKRYITCGPGESALSCFDRYAGDLKLRQGKRGDDFHVCGPGDDDISCLDKYIAAIKLSESSTQKRSIDCQPGNDDISCFDRYMNSIKLRLAKRSNSFCSPGEDNLACFDRYVQNIKVKMPTHHMKRLATCGPGESGLSCFDSYINNIKLKHGMAIKRTPIHCQPGLNEISCFDKYVHDIKTISSRNIINPQYKRTSIGHDPVESVSRAESWSSSLCPASVSRIECFERYMARMLKSIKPNDNLDRSNIKDYDISDYAEDSISNEVNKRSANSFCPTSMDRLDCFHHYLSTWVRTAAVPPKRTFRFGPGKRTVSSDKADDLPSKGKKWEAVTETCSDQPDSSSCLQKLMDGFITVTNIQNEKDLKNAVATLCDASLDPEKCEQKLFHVATGQDSGTIGDQHQSPLVKRERESRSICPTGFNQVKCFESLLHAYVHKVVPKESSEFIGRSIS